MSIELIVFLKFCAFTSPFLALYAFLEWSVRRERANEKLAKADGRGA